MNALYTATALARKHGSRLKLLFVHDNYNKYYPQINLHNVNDILRALATLSKLVKDNDNVPCGYSYVMGDVCNSIINVSNTEKADLVVMGKNGNSGRKKKFAGSNTATVIRKSACPVLLIPAGKTWNSFTRILFPVRPTLSMIDKFTLIKEIAKKNNSCLHILNLRNPSCINDLHIISRLVQLLKIKTKEDNIQTLFTYYFKDAKFADKILSVAHDSEKEIDLLVITSQDNDAHNNSFISSYAQKIIHHANVPVLIIRPDTIEHSKKVVLNELEKQLNHT